MTKMRLNLLFIILFFVFSSTVFAYNCDVPLNKLITDTQRNSDYPPLPYMQYFPLHIVEVDTPTFNSYAGIETSPDMNALYLDDKRQIVVNHDREKFMSPLVSCSVIVHELCHHFQNITHTKMTKPQREMQCYFVQHKYIANYMGKDWGKKGNPLPTGANGMRSVKEFKMIEQAKAADGKTDFDPTKYTCTTDKIYGTTVCKRKTK